MARKIGEFYIQQNVPMPGRKHEKYPFGDMKLDECIIFSYATDNKEEIDAAVHTWNSRLKKVGHMLSVHKIDKEKFGVWRIKRRNV